MFRPGDYLSELLTDGPPAARCELVRPLPSDDFGPRVLARLKVAAEQAKIELSSVMSVPIVLPFVAVKGGEALTFETELTREIFEGLVRVDASHAGHSGHAGHTSHEGHGGKK